MKQELEILNSSYWVHFKYAKELSEYLEPDHPRRIKAEKELTKMLNRIHFLNQKLLK